jgi:4-diphosphocytidyl-2-C-methyl-D-erythritol kinase
MSEPRRARVRALAKINLDLRVLGKRPDGYHELRTIFQTISLADRMEISFTPARASSVELEERTAIPDNLAARAARLLMEACGIRGRVRIALDKRIPMGAGLGGGSSDAAAVLLALPALAGKALDLSRLCEIGQQLGSDVPFFLLGGTAVGIGRGTELFPLPDRPSSPGLLVTPDLHVSTAEAYALLAPRLTSELQQNKIFSFQSNAWWSAGTRFPADGMGELPAAANDFEAVVFERHGRLAKLKKQLLRAGAPVAMMTGSGSALFGLFRARDDVSRAVELLKQEQTFRISLVSRARYRSLWWAVLEKHVHGRVWPPRSRYM